MESVVNSTDSNELQGTQYFLWVMYCDSNFDVQFDLNATWLFRIDCLIWILLCTVIVVITNASFPSGQLVIWMETQKSASGSKLCSKLCPNLRVMLDYLCQIRYTQIHTISKSATSIYWVNLGLKIMFLICVCECVYEYVCVFCKEVEAMIIAFEEFLI